MSSGPSRALLKFHLDRITKAFPEGEFDAEKFFQDDLEAPDGLSQTDRSYFFHSVGYLTGSADALDMTVIELLDDEGLL